MEREGFAITARTLSLSSGAAYDFTFNLTVGVSGTSVEVQGESTLLEASRSQIAGTVALTETTAMPINGRNFLDLALLIPGVSPTNTAVISYLRKRRRCQARAFLLAASAIFRIALWSMGCRPTTMRPVFTGAFFRLDTVQELQVVTSGGQAELGRALGEFASVVSKNDVNTPHGDLYGHFRNHCLHTANPLSNTKPPVTQAQYGLSLGGPPVRDLRFYFRNFEQRQWKYWPRRSTRSTIVIT